MLLAGVATAYEPDGAGLQPGVLPEKWKTSSSNCVTTPHWEVNAYNDDFYILRESTCFDAEKPFLYLIFGDEKALLFDTGLGSADLAKRLIARWASTKKRAPVPLIVLHTHAHADHLAGDKEFQRMPDVQLIAATPDAVSTFAGIKSWPTGLGAVDLGKRVLDLIPIPGHDAASIALYDRQTGNLMTGDSVYPGRLHVAEAEIPTFAASAKRLADFAKDHPIAHVLGAHVEQSNVPYLDYPRHAPQPEEHPLALSRAHLIELNAAFMAMNGKADRVIMPDTILDPRRPNTQAPANTGSTMGLDPGSVPAKWMSGGPNCLEVPDWQVHEYNPDFLILRESGCVYYDKPYLYLIFGQDKALLQDTGGGDVQTAPFVMDLIDRWAKKNNRKPVPLVIIHSHSHGGHTAGDKQFGGMENTHLIAHNMTDIQKATGISNWPSEIGKIDLGGRVIDVIPMPGHTADSLVLYDRKTGNLLTGDSLFAGRLCVGQSELADYRASAQRLTDFVTTHPVAHVLGGHVEQTNTPYLEYPLGASYQEVEHSLSLTRAHIFELDQALVDMGGKLRKAAYPDFTIVPEDACAAAPHTRATAR
jgi:glyoxylase-like metal-dependent hydrolase (beta-lactamase superfamily II)